MKTRPWYIKSAYLLLLLAGLLLSSCDKDELVGGNDFADLTGRAYDIEAGNVPMAGVAIIFAGRDTVTAADGSYTFLAVPVGTHQFTATKAGYQVYQTNVAIRVDPPTGSVNRHSFYMRYE
ncbi:MAG: carboxypeptidase-like regulatory domain-containing protein [candidate division Zixibacteria bacterium]|nr:carboxypeptidase-like regulatory domain-containing protein [candidate division Zixibacteria bacterium]